MITVDRLDPNHPDRLMFFGEHADASVALAVGGRLHRGVAYCVMRVSDSGGGMDQSTLDRVFEPFFTTKHRAQGTGLGLAVVHGIIAGNQGAYLVRSRLGVGSEFSVYLPLVDDVEPASPVGDDRELVRGQESVLIVDDETDITDLSPRRARAAWL
ncbi:MAG: ATP-binding protein [Pseudomonadota bacterium]